MKNISILSVVIILNLFGFNSFAQKNDENQIKAIIEKETETWRIKDVKGHAECWAIRPYGRILVSTEEGTAIDISPSEMVNAKAEIMGFDGKSVNSNYKYAINGNTAWVSYDQVKIDSKEQKSHSFEMRMLEKTNMKWKIVGMSVHHYKLK